MNVNDVQFGTPDHIRKREAFAVEVREFLRVVDSRPGEWAEFPRPLEGAELRIVHQLAAPGVHQISQKHYAGVSSLVWVRRSVPRAAQIDQPVDRRPRRGLFRREVTR